MFDFLPSEISVAEKYASHIEGTQNQMIYIRRLPYKSASIRLGENAPSAVCSGASVTHNPFERHRYALKDRRVSKIIRILPSSYEWDIRLGAPLNTPE